MKMKKILSIVSAIALCASFAATSVSAAISVDGETSLITGVPTKAEVEARTPEITLSAVKAESKADVQAAGIAALAAGTYYKDGQDAYVITVTATNIGELGCGYKVGNYDDADKAGLMVNALTLSFTNSDKIVAKGIGSVSFSSSKSIGVQGTLNAVFGSVTDMGYTNPTYDAETLMGQKLEDPTLTAKLVIAITAGETLDLVTENAVINYVIGDGTVGTLVPVTVDVDTVTLGEVAQEDEIVTGDDQTFVATVENATTEHTGVKFNFSTDYSKATNTTGSYSVPFGTGIENGSAVVALTVTDIVASINGTAVAFNCTGVELY